MHCQQQQQSTIGREEMMMIEEEGVLVIIMHLFWRVDFVVIVPSTFNQFLVITTYDKRHNKASPPSLPPPSWLLITCTGLSFSWTD
jgi:hypothetical protein